VAIGFIGEGNTEKTRKQVTDKLYNKQLYRVHHELGSNSQL